MKPEAPALEFAAYAASQWRQIAISCTAALVLAGVAGLILPKRYTATATLVIEPPAGSDPRTATAINPVYLESLKTYEHLASGDSLFLEALEHTGLRQRFADKSVDSLKRSVLKVTKPVNTRVLEISATLENPREAQQLAQYIAEHAAALNRDLDARESAEAAKEAEANYTRAVRRNSEAAAESAGFAPTLSALESEVSNASELRYNVQRDLIEARSDAAASGDDSAKARVADLERQDAALGRTVQTRSEELERLRLRREALDSNLKTARADLQAAKTKLDDLNAAAPFRGERLEVSDPGIVPQRPSFPNTPLNLVVALVISFVAAIVWLALRFGYERASEPKHDRVYSRIA